nr:HEPN domain-containing protein [Clostridia bacterium]
MDGSITALSKYRFARALEDLQTAESNLHAGSYRASVNRSYYAVFHALRAITALDQFDSAKHSGIIAFFNQHYVKTGEFDKTFSKLIDKSFRLREKADYEDFYIVTQEEAISQLEKAKTVVNTIEKYLSRKWVTNDSEL